MKKIVTSLIITAIYGLGQSNAYAHGPHGVESSLSHQFTEPQHLISLLAISAVLALAYGVKNRLQAVRAQK